MIVMSPPTDVQTHLHWILAVLHESLKIPIYIETELLAFNILYT